MSQGDAALVVPETLQEFLETMAKESLAHDFYITFGIEVPSYILSGSRILQQTAEEWRRRLDEPIQLFAQAAMRALKHLPHDLRRANDAFVSDIESLPGVNAFLKDERQQYIIKLIAATHADAERFSQILRIFAELKR